ncbi:TetR/AcrR family transcriptional regulator [Streptomyces sp. NBC_01803]|uniref:TetR/AcrR family transcriptional regulator n=1 Tax=Streptomyces sp. NBC_01803 TaxID=2975946 RepID=UPI002DDB6308|nr:TetR/AcrR family transcriptional regulator [Streptomyces sp. NBC_01803]WSA46082.1 TetR/AcrR family transcriptional regulator [Streptomyces sp. NBC_01803]
MPDVLTPPAPRVNPVPHQSEPPFEGEDATLPTARESLLRAARDALERRPWPMVRMVEIATDAGVSRQTLYNEFGDKAGLGSALAERQVTALLDEFGSFCADEHRTPAAILAGTTDWIVRAAHADVLVHGALVGCPGARLPRSAWGPGALIAELRDRAVRALARRTPPAEAAGLPHRCETAIRLAVSHLVAPAPGGR